MSESFLFKVLTKYNVSVVIHLAAQPGVRYSLKKPADYVKTISWLQQTYLRLVESPKKLNIFIKSSSSVYAASKKIPYDENDPADFPAILCCNKTINRTWLTVIVIYIKFHVL